MKQALDLHGRTFSVSDSLCRRANVRNGWEADVVAAMFCA